MPELGAIQNVSVNLDINHTCVNDMQIRLTSPAGTTRILSRRELQQLVVRIEEWQEHIQRLARDADLDIVRVGLDRWAMETALVNFVAERRLRKV